MRTKLKASFLMLIIVFGLNHFANADTIYLHNGKKEVTKGQAIIILLNDSKADIKEVKDMKLNEEKATLVKK